MDASFMNKEEENRYFSSELKLKTIELENKLLLEKQRYNLLQSELESSVSIASRRLNFYKNECVSLQVKLNSLENDYNLLKEKELKSQETIKNLLKKIERVDREHGSENQKNCENLKKNDDEVNIEEDTQDNAKEKDATEKEAENTRLFIDLDSDSDDGMKHSTELESPDTVKYNQNQGEKKISKLSDRRLPLRVSDNELLTSKKRNRSFCRHREYNGRPADDEQRLDAMIRARKIQRNLTLGNPSFIRSMARSHVSGSFWLALNPEFCNKHLGKSTYNMILQDEKGSDFEVKYIGRVSALSGGWAGFARAHKLELYDAVLFELCKPAKFKVYIIKANEKPFDDPQGNLEAAETMEDEDIDLSDVCTNRNRMNRPFKYLDANNGESKDFFKF